MASNRVTSSLPNHRKFVKGRKEFVDLLRQSDNSVCADCGAPNPKWASTNIGVFVCKRCSDVHKELGPNISTVLSVTDESWSDDQVDAMIEVGGNCNANKIYEAYIPKGVLKPGENSSHEERLKFIRSKYENQEFLKPSLRITPVKSAACLQPSFSWKILNSFRASSMPRTPPNPESMEGFIGSLKVKVKKGTDLAIRDMRTSDPYVVLTLGKHAVRTSVIKSNLNPVWNEDLTLSVPQDYGPVKLCVYDHDMFSKDDIMGEAEIDIQPLVTSYMAFGDPSMFADMQIGKWLKSHDNALLHDSTINIVDGKVKQEIFFQLQNVESGKLELELEWIPLNP